MATLTVPESEADRLVHLAEYASPAERARNQLILVITVFVVGATLRVFGLSWWVTLPVAAGVGLVASMVVLEAWERSTGRRSARTVTEDRLAPARARLLEGLQGYVVRGDAATRDADGLQLTVSVRMDAAPLPGPEEVTGGTILGGSPLPLKGTRYPASNGGIAVVPAAWLWVEVRSGADPRESTPEESEGEGLDCVRGLSDALQRALQESGAGPGLRRALGFNRPWAHRLTVWPEAVVFTTPLTEAAAGRDLGKLASLLGRWHRRRQQDGQQREALN